MQQDYFVNLFPLQLVKVSGSRGALVGLQLEVVGDKEDGGGVEVACARHGEGVLLPRLEEP